MLIGQQKVVLQVPDGRAVTKIRPYMECRMPKLNKK